jgi:hypothetical protein
MAMMKLLIRRSCSRRRAAAPALAANSALRGRVALHEMALHQTALHQTALHQTALILPFGRAFPRKPALTRLPLASAAIITQLRASLDQEFAASTAIGPLWAGGVGGLPAQARCDRCC